jgi:shikimate kinase
MPPVPKRAPATGCSEPSMPRHVVLLGLMGSGKTTVGRGLAIRLGRPIRDSDTDIEAATGRSGRQIAEERGTAELHRIEARHLVDTLATETPSVVCSAASVIDDPACRAALAEPGLLLVWLRADPAAIAGWSPPDGHRRDLGPDRVARLAEQAATRYPMYAALRQFTVDVAGRSPDELVELIAGFVAGDTPGARLSPRRSSPADR